MPKAIIGKENGTNTTDFRLNNIHKLPPWCWLLGGRGPMKRMNTKYLNKGGLLLRKERNDIGAVSVKGIVKGIG